MAGEWYHLLYNNVYDIAPPSSGSPTPTVRACESGMRARPSWACGSALLLEGQPFEVWGGEQLRDFTYVDDAVEALLLAASPEARGQVYNLGGNQA